VLLLPTMPLMSAARVLKCLATVPDGWPGYHGLQASRMARYLRRLSLIASSFWTGCAFQREYTMGQPLKCSLQNDLQKCPVEKLGGVHQITKHHRKLSPFGFWCVWGCW
jgi:hypothetical protein